MKRVRIEVWADIPDDGESGDAIDDIVARLPRGWVPVYGVSEDAPDFRAEDEDDGPMCCEGKIPNHTPECLAHTGPRPDLLVRDLLAYAPNLLLDFDDETGACIAPAIIPEAYEEDDTRTYPRLEYQVSDGLPGNRARSWDFDTYAEAEKEFPRMVAHVKERRAARFGR